MSLCLVHGRALVGLQAPAVTVEVHMANGLPSFTKLRSQVDKLAASVSKRGR